MQHPHRQPELLRRVAHLLPEELREGWEVADGQRYCEVQCSGTHYDCTLMASHLTATVRYTHGTARNVVLPTYGRHGYRLGYRCPEPCCHSVAFLHWARTARPEAIEIATSLWEHQCDINALPRRSSSGGRHRWDDFDTPDRTMTAAQLLPMPAGWLYAAARQRPSDRGADACGRRRAR